jgi:hypothetical protein
LSAFPDPAELPVTSAGKYPRCADVESTVGPDLQDAPATAAGAALTSPIAAAAAPACTSAAAAGTIGAVVEEAPFLASASAASAAALPAAGAPGTPGAAAPASGTARGQRVKAGDGMGPAAARVAVSPTTSHAAHSR